MGSKVHCDIAVVRRASMTKLYMEADEALRCGERSGDRAAGEQKLTHALTSCTPLVSDSGLATLQLLMPTSFPPLPVFRHIQGPPPLHLVYIEAIDPILKLHHTTHRVVLASPVTDGNELLLLPPPPRFGWWFVVLLKRYSTSPRNENRHF